LLRLSYLTSFILPTIERRTKHSLLSSLRTNVEISGWGRERAAFNAPHIVLEDLRHGWEAVRF
jgi:hypothetical protein